MSMSIVTMAAGARGGAAVKRVTHRLREMGATRRDTAQPLPQVPRNHRRDVERLIERGIIRQAQPGAYYLDESALADYRGRRRTIALSLIIAFAGLLAGLVLAR